MAVANAGKENTLETLNSAFAFAKKRGIDTIVVASTYGDTGLEAAKQGKAAGYRVLVVTHNVGFKTPCEVELTAKMRQAIEALGATVHTGTMVLRGLGAAFRKKFQTSDEEVTASVLRMFGQGMKVCVEMGAMVADAGLVHHENEIICVAGTARGADTAVLLKPASSNNFFDIKVRHVIVKPEQF